MKRNEILELLTHHCAGVAQTKENGLVATKVYLDDLADDLLSLLSKEKELSQKWKANNYHNSKD